MGNAYASIQSQSELEFFRLRAEIVLSEHVFMSAEDIVNPNIFPNWLHVLTAREVSDEGDVNAEIRQLKTQLKSQNDELRKQFKQQSDAILARLEALEEGVTSRINSKIKSTKLVFSEEMANLTREMKR
jgi:hypothetical protein